MHTDTPPESPDFPESAVNGWNADYVDALYQRWIDNPEAVDPQWVRYFEGFDLGYRRREEENGETPLLDPARPAPKARPPVVPTTASDPSASGRGFDVAQTKQGRVDSLIYHYRDIGHLAADIDPLATDRPFPEQLTLESFDLVDDDLGEAFDPGHLPIDSPAPLTEIIECLEDTYCRHIGVEYMHIQDRVQRRWLQKRMETVRNAPAFEARHKKRVMDAVRRATGLEAFLDTRYKGKKWFSLSGSESLIPLLAEIIEQGPVNGVAEFTCGMAHRGRVNVLVNIFGKTYQELFTEFHETWDEDYLEGGGDVKYHRGYSCDYHTHSGQFLRLTMASNPSHLEFVTPVVLGKCRAKQRVRENEESRDQVVPVLLHGDASFPAQGIVAECLNMVELDGYRVGGSIHVIVNNQIGFTTNPVDARSARYCTDIAKMTGAPIFHVNGDDPEACAFVARLALEYRQAFKNDVVLDMWCYRKFGHNESDEPAFTQPLMYDRIKQKKPVADIYAERLAREGVLSKDENQQLTAALRQSLDSAQSDSKQEPVDPTPDPFRNIWKGLTHEYSDDPVETAVSLATLKKIGRTLGGVPKGFNPHRKIKKLLGQRGKAVMDNEPLDWAMGELLAYGSILVDGHAVRFTGQDVERGTFSHRHCVVFDSKTGQAHTALNHIKDGQGHFCVHNSPLSEQSCVGFEYGYSLADPQMLIIWEAQFGDFANGAQVIFDQFIASAEVKWQRHSGIVLLLPHGYEGQGPEHSSARMERFLQLCADDNLQVVYPTTPAQIFHVMRRQLRRNFRTPLVVMSPKSLLRHKETVSHVADLTKGEFQRVIDDAGPKPTDVDRIVFCSGKVYYDLNQERIKNKHKNVAIIRIEQLYPFPFDLVEEVFAKYENAEEVLYVQEEPANAGAFRFLEPLFREELEIDLIFVGRDASATPAVGSSKVHAEEQADIVAATFAPLEDEEQEEIDDEDIEEVDEVEEEELEEEPVDEPEEAAMAE